MIKKNSVLKELWVGCVAIGVLLQGTAIWLFKDKVSFSIGLWIGVAGALFMAWSMARNAYKIVNSTQGATDRTMRIGVLIRYLVAAGVIIATIYLPKTDPIATFLGLISLKFAAYLQPVTHRIMRRFIKGEQMHEKE